MEIWDCLTNQQVFDSVSKSLKENKDIKILKIFEEMKDVIVDKDIYNETNMKCIIWPVW